MRLNGVEDRVDLVLGDNRSVGDEALGTADRVLMGYIPTPRQFIERALAFLKPHGGVVHYHFTSPRAEANALVAEHFGEHLDATQFSMTALRKVKSYKPRVDHFVADVLVQR